MNTLTINLEKTLNLFQINYLKASMERSRLFDDVHVHSHCVEYSLGPESNETTAEKTLKRLIDICNNLKSEILYKSDYSTPSDADPMANLLDTRQAIPLDNGIFIFQGEFLRLMRFFDNYIYAKARELDALDQQYPILWPIELFKDINYIKNFPQSTPLQAQSRCQCSTRITVNLMIINRILVRLADVVI